MLQNLVQKDKLLAKYFMPNKADPKVAQKLKTILKRMKIVEAELAEIKANM
jgi:hypothetical protein